MLPVEEKLRSAARVAVMFMTGFLAAWVILVVLLHPHKGPVVAPCPPQECVLHPYAPHAPGG